MAFAPAMSYAGDSHMRVCVLHSILRSLTMFCAFTALSACDPTSPEAPPPTTLRARDAAKPFLWKRVHEATVVAVDDDPTIRALARATAEARRTANDARERWTIAKAAEHRLWAVKWAAPLADSSSGDHVPPMEYVWVQPVNWSPFRIEGVLLSVPTAPLECRRVQGEMVSFPIDELSDWMHFASESPGAAFEGGYTVRVLEEKYGKTVD